MNNATEEQAGYMNAPSVSMRFDLHMTPCPWCSALVQNAHADRHGDWHRVNEFHAPECDWLLNKNAQRETGAYLTPQPCSCGVAR